MKFINFNKKKVNNINLNKINAAKGVSSRYLNTLFLLLSVKTNKINTLNTGVCLSNTTNNIFTQNKNTNKLIVLSKVVPFLNKNGNSFKNSIVVFNMFSKIYSILNSNLVSENLTQYKYYKEFLYNYSMYSNYKNSNFLVSWILNWAQPMFCVDCVVVPKKYRKKLKKKYLYKIKYLNKFKRISKVLNWIVKYSNTISNYSVFNRQLLVYLDLLLNYKNSYLYNKKLLVYKKIFKV